MGRGREAKVIRNFRSSYSEYKIITHFHKYFMRYLFPHNFTSRRSWVLISPSFLPTTTEDTRRLKIIPHNSFNFLLPSSHSPLHIALVLRPSEEISSPSLAFFMLDEWRSIKVSVGGEGGIKSIRKVWRNICIHHFVFRVQLTFLLIIDVSSASLTIHTQHQNVGQPHTRDLNAFPIGIMQSTHLGDL